MDVHNGKIDFSIYDLMPEITGLRAKRMGHNFDLFMENPDGCSEADMIVYRDECHLPFSGMEFKITNGKGIYEVSILLKKEQRLEYVTINNLLYENIPAKDIYGPTLAIDKPSLDIMARAMGYMKQEAYDYEQGPDDRLELILGVAAFAMKYGIDLKTENEHLARSEYAVKFGELPYENVLQDALWISGHLVIDNCELQSESPEVWKGHGRFADVRYGAGKDGIKAPLALLVPDKRFDPYIARTW